MATNPLAPASLVFSRNTRSGFSGFHWDGGNRAECCKHGLTAADIEYVLSHGAAVIRPDAAHSEGETRFLAIGRTRAGRYAFVVFTPRTAEGTTLLRPISARYMHLKEVRRYEQEIARTAERRGGGGAA
jgi:hypothetical protein